VKKRTAEAPEAVQRILGRAHVQIATAPTALPAREAAIQPVGVQTNVAAGVARVAHGDPVAAGRARAAATVRVGRDAVAAGRTPTGRGDPLAVARILHLPAVERGDRPGVRTPHVVRIRARIGVVRRLARRVDVAVAAPRHQARVAGRVRRQRPTTGRTTPAQRRQQVAQPVGHARPLGSRGVGARQGGRCNRTRRTGASCQHQEAHQVQAEPASFHSRIPSLPYGQRIGIGRRCGDG
jgi:hypothetical protein